jgi:cytochrome c oxidase subunit 2
MNIKNYLITFCDAPEPWQFGIQDPATPVMEGMIFFHNYLLFFLIFIATAVFWLFFKIIIDFNDEVRQSSIPFTHSSVLEIIWTILPAIILVIIAVPSFALLYSLEELIDPSITLKVVGHQ